MKDCGCEISECCSKCIQRRYPREHEAPSELDKMIMAKMDSKTDEIERPAHYTKGKIEPADVIDDQDFGHFAACIIKYIFRYRWKGTPLKDLKKARWYLDRLIKHAENGVIK